MYCDLWLHKSAETIQGRKLFKGGNYSRKYGNWTISNCNLFFTCITWLFNFVECFATFQKTCNRIAVFKRTGKKEGWMPLPATIACLITLIWSAFYGNFHIGPWDMKLALPVCFTRSPYQSNYRTRASITCSWLETTLEY